MNDPICFHNDHWGGTNVVTNQAGAVEERTQYTPYGKVISGGISNKLYTGQTKDKETGLMYYGARYYNPQFRRFTQPDPIIKDIYDPQNLNRYAYTMNNPMKYVDPTGAETTSRRVFNRRTGKYKWFIDVDGEEVGYISKNVFYKSREGNDDRWDQEVTLTDGSTKMLSEIIDDNQDFMIWSKNDLKNFALDFGLSLSQLKGANKIVKSEKALEALRILDTVEDATSVSTRIMDSDSNDKHMLEDIRDILWEGTELVPVWGSVKVTLDYTVFYKGMGDGDRVKDPIMQYDVDTEFGGYYE